MVYQLCLDGVYFQAYPSTRLGSSVTEVTVSKTCLTLSCSGATTDTQTHGNKLQSYSALPDILTQHKILHMMKPL